MKTNRYTITVSGFAFYFLASSLIFRLVLGNTILNNVYPYTTEGGHPLLKIHPGTWMLFLALVIFGGVIGYGRLLSDFAKNKPLFVAAVCNGITISYSLVMWGTAGVAYFIDTYFYSLLAIFLAFYLNEKQTIKLLKVIVSVIAVNALIAVYEYITRSHLVPNPLAGTGWFFRANALMAHPLNNALVTIPVALGVLIAPISNPWRWAISLLCLSALLAFATRASLAVYTVTTILIVWTYAFTANLSKRNRLLYVAILPIVATFLFVGFYLAIFHTEIGFGIASRFTFDTSAMARLEAFDFLRRIDAGIYLLGAGPEGFSQLVAKLSSVSIIENFWVQLIVTLGLPVFCIFIYGFFVLTKWLAAGSSLQFKMIILAFLVAASTNNSLTIKTAALVVFLLTLYLIKKMRAYRATSDR